MSISHTKLIVIKTKLLAISLVSLFFFTACHQASRSNETDSFGLAELKMEEPLQKLERDKQQIPVGTISATDSTASPLQTTRSTNPDWDKKMIKTGSLRVEVKNFRNFSNSVHTNIKRFGAYIAQEEQTSTDEKTETVITIKVPVDQFENMINQLPGEEDKVLERKISTEDVTGDIVDTKARLEARKQMRAKYLELLKQSKNMEDALSVQNSVNGVQEEIESAADRVQALSHQALFSTINLTFFQPAAGYSAPDANPGFLTRIGQAFKTGGTWLADLFVGLISVWPLLLVIGLLYIGWKKMKPVRTVAGNP